MGKGNRNNRNAADSTSVSRNGTSRKRIASKEQASERNSGPFSHEAYTPVITDEMRERGLEAYIQGQQELIAKMKARSSEGLSEHRETASSDPFSSEAYTPSITEESRERSLAAYIQGQQNLVEKIKSNREKERLRLIAQANKKQG